MESWLLPVRQNSYRECEARGLEEGPAGQGQGLSEDAPGRHPLLRRRVQRLQFPLAVHRAEMLNAVIATRPGPASWPLRPALPVRRAGADVPSR